MFWKKLGLLFNPLDYDRHVNLISHAANPVPVHLEHDTYRIFYSGRDLKNRSSIGAVDINIVTRKVINYIREPFFEHGPEGSFFADGVSIGNCYEAGGVDYLLFMGWQSQSGAHWRGDIGRLRVGKNFTLALANEDVFMGINSVDPISLSYPWVMKCGDQDYRMWYGSTLSWDVGNDEMLHVIHSAFSNDGHSWHRGGLSVPYEKNVAQAFSRPTVIKNADGHFEMWFSYRGGSGDKYRIGYAYSYDGFSWTLALNECALSTSTDGWDSEMVEYPFVFSHKGVLFMLYNGNGFGKSGFGLAELINE